MNNASLSALKLFLFLLKLYSYGAQNCLIFEEGENGGSCKYCKAGYGKAAAEICKPFLDTSEGSARVVYIASTSTLNWETKTQIFDNLYEDITTAFIEEDKIGNSLLSRYGFLYIKLLKGDHFMIFSERIKSYSELFTRSRFEINISPLFCYEAPAELTDDCYQANTFAKIYLKNRFFSIFVSRRLNVTNIIFDGRDTVLSLSNNSCSREKRVCCANKCSFNKNISLILPIEFPSLFIIEPIIDNSNVSQCPELVIENVLFDNIFLSFDEDNDNTGKSSKFIVLMFNTGGSLLMINTTLNNSNLIYGIIYKSDDFRSIYQAVIDTLNITFFKSKIIIIGSTFSLINLNNFKSLGAMICLKNFQGSFLFKDSKAISLYYLSHSLIYAENTVPAQTSELLIEGSFFGFNSFSEFALIKDFYDRVGVSCKIQNNLIVENYFNAFIKIKNLKLFLISGSFSDNFVKSYLEYFLLAVYSNVVLERSDFIKIFSILGIGSPLIKVTSSYFVQYDKVFIDKKEKNVSNDSISIIDCKFSRASVNLFSNTALNFNLNISNCIFEYFTFDSNNNTKPFIELTSEGLLIMNNVSFNNTKTTYNLMRVNYFTIVIIKSVTFDYINTSDGNLFLFFAMCPSIPAINQINFINVKLSNIMVDITKKKFGEYKVLIQSISLETPKAPGVYLENIFIENIHYNIENKLNQVLRFDNCLLIANKIIGRNIKRAYFLAHNPLINSSILYINEMQVLNPFGYGLISFLTCGLVPFSKAEIRNSSFSSTNVTSLKAIDFSFAQVLLLDNVDIDAYQISGSIIFSQAVDMSSVYFNKIFITTRFGSKASLITFLAQMNYSNFPWLSPEIIKREFYKGNYNNFGIRNSFFYSNFEPAINLPLSTEILMFQCFFSEAYSNEGSVINIKQRSHAVLINCTIVKAEAETLGGALAIFERSILIMIDSLIQDVSSGKKGGFISSLESIVHIINSQVFNSESTLGGLIFGDESEIIIQGCKFKNITAKQFGGLLFSKQGNFSINSSFIIKAKSFKIGGALYMETTNFKLINTDLILCSSEISIIYALTGDEKNTPLIEKALFYNNSARSKGLLLLFDYNINILKTDFLGNLLETGYMCVFIGFFTKPQITIEIYSVREDNKAEIIFFLNDVELILKKGVIFLDSGSFPQYLKVTKSKIFLNETGVIFVNKTTPKKSNFYTLKVLSDLTESYVTISFSFFRMNEFMGLMHCLKCLKVILISAIFNKCSYNHGSVIYLQDSLFEGSFLHLKENKALQGGAIYSRDSLISISSSIFSKNTAEFEGSNFYVLSKNFDSNMSIKITGSLFLNVSGVSIFSENLAVSIILSYFIGENNIVNQAFKIISSSSISILQSAFYYSYNRSTIQIDTKEYIQTLIKIQDSNFYQSESPYDTGAFLKIQGQYIIEITNSKFKNGFSEKGGAIHFICQIDSACSISINTCVFQNNYASKSGGAVLSETNSLNYSSCSFINNTAEIGSDINYFPFKFLIFRGMNNSEAFKIEDILEDYYCINEKVINVGEGLIEAVPGYNISIGVLIVDKENNIQKFEDGTKIKIYISNEDKPNYSFKNNMANVIMGASVFDGLTLLGPVNNEIKARILYENKGTQIEAKLKIKVGSCLRGEVFEGFECRPCKEASFSLDIPMYSNSSPNVCSKCPDFAYCPGRDIIVPFENFWIKDKNSSIVVACKKKKACPLQPFLQINDPNYRFECEMGYEGIICDACSKGFGLVKDLCLQCTDGKSIFIIIFMLGLIVCLIYFLIEERRSGSRSTEQDIPLLKILVNHLSIFAMLSSMKVNWSDFIKDFYTIASAYTTTNPSSIFSLECFFGWDSKEKTFNILIVAGTAPIILNILLFTLKILINRFKAVAFYLKIKNKKGKLHEFKNYCNKDIFWIFSEFLKHMTIIFFNIYPQILIFMFNSFGCKKFDNTGSLYLSQAPWIECYSELHLRLIIISVSFIVLWGIITPIVIAINVYRIEVGGDIEHIKQKINFKAKGSNAVSNKSIIVSNKNVIRNFLLMGFKKKFFYWEIIIFFRKIVILCIVSFSEEMDSISLGGIIVLFLSFFLICTLILNPYDGKAINFMETFSLLVSIISIGMGIITSFGSEINDFWFFVYSMILVFSNLFFIITWALVYVNSLSLNLIKRIQSFLKLGKFSAGKKK